MLLVALSLFEDVSADFFEVGTVADAARWSRVARGMKS